MRPKLGDRKRSIFMGIKVTPEMRNRIDVQASLECLTLSTFIVKVLQEYLDAAQCIDKLPPMAE